MSPRFSSLIAVTLWLTSVVATAAPWYRVEVILIAYQDEQLIGDEQWPDALPLPEASFKAPDLRWWHTPPVNQHNAWLAGFGFRTAPPSSWDLPLQPLPTLHLQAEAERLQKQKNMNVIWHQAWVEPIQEQEQAILHPLDIRFSDQLDIRLSGNLSLHRSRFLHLSTDLVIQHFQPQPAPVLPELETQSSDVRNDYLSDLLTQAAIESSLAGETAEIPVRAAHIHQSRRMRSGELHYIDHPLLGIVVKVVPVVDAGSL